MSLSKKLDGKELRIIAARYLQYFLYLCPNPECAALLKLAEIEYHTCARFQAFQDDQNQWRWRLKASNGLPLADSGQGFTTERECLDGIDLVKTCGTAPVVED